MARILTGIQSSGKPHLGNLLGAIIPAIHLSQDPKNDSFFFIADFHSLTTIKDAKQRIENTYAVAAAWISFGFDTEKNTFYRQSRVAEVAELAWYLSCFTPYPMMANAVSFKEKSENLSDVNTGVFIYPILMAADILLYDANFVPVGKDQQQHLEITRDIAKAINNFYEEEIFVVPEGKIEESVMIIPGTDGRKMSKSYGNIIDIFLPDKQLEKAVKAIVTDSLPLEAPKNPDNCNVFRLYSLLGSTNETDEMRKKYLAGNYGYGHAKKELFELIKEKYKDERKTFNYYMENPEEINRLLSEGEAKAREVANQVLNRVRKVMGFRNI